MDDPDRLISVSEELLLQLLQRVIQGGKLTPKIAASFVAAAEARRHSALRSFIGALQLRDPPPVVRTAAAPLLCMSVFV